MPRVLARRAPAATAGGSPPLVAHEAAPELVEWVEWADEPRHELLFDVPEPCPPRAEEEVKKGTKDGGGKAKAAPLAARAYSAVFPCGGERFTLFHRHREDTAYVCVSSAADDPDAAEVWNEQLREIAAADDADTDADAPPSSPPPASQQPTHEILPAWRVVHSTGQCFCNPHGTRDRGKYIHRIRYASSNPRTLHFVGVEVRPAASAVAGGGGDGKNDPPAPASSLPRPAPHLPLTPEGEQPGLFRVWRLSLPGGGGAAAAPSPSSSSSSSGALGGGFARRGGAVVLIKGIDWSKVEGGGEGTRGPFGAAALKRARAAGGWAGAAGAAIFPEGATWPLTPEDGRAEFALPSVKEGAVLEAMLVEFL